MKKFKKVYDSLTPHLEEFPPRDGEEIPMFHKLLVVRCLRPDAVTAAVMDFVKNSLDHRFVEPPVLNLRHFHVYIVCVCVCACLQSFNDRAVFEDSHKTSPLIFILSPSADPITDLIKFADQKVWHIVDQVPKA